MTSEPAYQSLFLGAGPQMQCGVGQFTRLLRETIEKIDPEAGTATVRMEHSVYVAEYGPHAGRRVCYMFASSLVGGMEYVAEAAGHPRALAAEEIQCGAEGADCCRFEVKPAGGS